MRILARAHYKITQCLMTMIDGGACMTPTSTCDLCRWSMKTRYLISQMHRLMGLKFFPWVLAARCKVPGVQCPVPTTALAWPVQQEDGGDVLEGAGGGGGSGGGGSGGGGSSSGGGGGSSSSLYTRRKNRIFFFFFFDVSALLCSGAERSQLMAAYLSPLYTRSI